MNSLDINLYNSASTEASKSALIEVLRTLSSYSDYFVLGGGWAPYYIIEHFSQNTQFQHCGSIDIDLFMHPDLRGTSQYATIVEILSTRGFNQADNRRFPFRFDKTIISHVNNQSYDIHLDFITEPPDIMLQEDLIAAGIRGCSISLDHFFIHPVRGIFPGNGIVTVDARVCNVLGCLVTKGLAMKGRFKEKDPYDVYAVITNYKNGPRDVAKEFKENLTNPIIIEALEAIKEQFISERSEGPYSVARFMSPGDQSMQSRVRTDAFMSVNEFLTNL